MANADVDTAVGMDEPVIVPVGGKWKGVSSHHGLRAETPEQREAAKVTLPASYCSPFDRS